MVDNKKVVKKMFVDAISNGMKVDDVFVVKAISKRTTKNGSNFMGLGMGEGYASMSIGTPTGDGLTKPTHFSRPLHCSMVGNLRIGPKMVVKFQ